MFPRATTVSGEGWWAVARGGGQDQSLSRVRRIVSRSLVDETNMDSVTVGNENTVPITETLFNGQFSILTVIMFFLSPLKSS